MTYHVDVVETDWSAGVDRLAARLALEDGAVSLVIGDLGEWGPKLLRPIPDGFGDVVTPDSDAKFFLTRLATSLEHGTYVFATPPHEEFACPLDGRTEVSMHEVEFSRQHFD